MDCAAPASFTHTRGIRGHQPKKLRTIFMRNGEAPVPEGERELWLPFKSPRRARVGSISCYLVFPKRTS